MVVCSLLSHQVWVNQYNLLNNNVPFGGKKQSGIGESCILLSSLPLVFHRWQEHAHDPLPLLASEPTAGLANMRL